MGILNVPRAACTFVTRCAGETLTSSGVSCPLKRKGRSRSTTARVSSWITLHWVTRDLGNHSFSTFPLSESMCKWTLLISSGENPTSFLLYPYAPIVCKTKRDIRRNLHLTCCPPRDAMHTPLVHKRNAGRCPGGVQRCKPCDGLGAFRRGLMSVFFWSP